MGHHKRLLWKIVECLSAQASNAEAASVAKTAQIPTWVKWRKKMKNVLPNSFEFLIHQFNSLNRELIHELWINSSIQPVSESYAQRFYHWGHAGVREIFRQQTLGCPLDSVDFFPALFDICRISIWISRTFKNLGNLNSPNPFYTFCVLYIEVL